MKDVDRHSADFDHITLRQFARRCTFVNVAPYGRHRRNRPKFIENLRSTHVARMNDAFGPAQRRYRFRTKQAMCV